VRFYDLMSLPNFTCLARSLWWYIPYIHHFLFYVLQNVIVTKAVYSAELCGDKPFYNSRLSCSNFAPALYVWASTMLSLQILGIEYRRGWHWNVLAISYENWSVGNQFWCGARAHIHTQTHTRAHAHRARWWHKPNVFLYEIKISWKWIWKLR
jgi:hypothetical protein